MLKWNRSKESSKQVISVLHTPGGKVGHRLERAYGYNLLYNNLTLLSYHLKSAWLRYIPNSTPKYTTWRLCCLCGPKEPCRNHLRSTVCDNKHWEPLKCLIEWIGSQSVEQDWSDLAHMQAVFSSNGLLQSNETKYILSLCNSNINIIMGSEKKQVRKLYNIYIYLWDTCMGFPGGSEVKCLPAMQKTWVLSLGQEDPLKEMQSTPVLLPGKFQGQRSLVGYTQWEGKESYMTEQLHISWILIS